MKQLDLSPEGQRAVEIYDQIYQNKADDKIQVYPDEMVARIVTGRYKRLGICNVLDAGCGEGRNTVMMASEGLNVTCLDTSNSALELAKNQAEVLGLSMSFNEGSITKLAIWRGSF